MRTLDRHSAIDLDLARRADRKLRRYGSSLNCALSAIVAARGLPPAMRPLPAAGRDPFFCEPNATHLRRAIADMDAGRNVVFHDILEIAACKGHYS